MDNIDNYKTLSSELKFKGSIFDVYSDIITLPDGRTAERQYITHGGAVAVLPVNERGNIVFVKQYRHPAGKIMLEIPAGTLDKGEKPIDCAIRELEEETALVAEAENLTHVTSMYTAVGFCTEIIHIYIAKNLKPGKHNFDPDEFIELCEFSKKQAFEMIKSGEIIDSKTITAILYLMRAGD